MKVGLALADPTNIAVDPMQTIGQELMRGAVRAAQVKQARNAMESMAEQINMATGNPAYGNFLKDSTIASMSAGQNPGTAMGFAQQHAMNMLRNAQYAQNQQAMLQAGGGGSRYRSYGGGGGGSYGGSGGSGGAAGGGDGSILDNPYAMTDNFKDLLARRADAVAMLRSKEMTEKQKNNMLLHISELDDELSRLNKNHVRGAAGYVDALKTATAARQASEVVPMLARRDLLPEGFVDPQDTYEQGDARKVAIANLENNLDIEAFKRKEHLNEMTAEAFKTSHEQKKEISKLEAEQQEKERIYWEEKNRRDAAAGMLSNMNELEDFESFENVYQQSLEDPTIRNNVPNPGMAKLFALRDNLDGDVLSSLRPNRQGYEVAEAISSAQRDGAGSLNFERDAAIAKIQNEPEEKRTETFVNTFNKIAMHEPEVPPVPVPMQGSVFLEFGKEVFGKQFEKIEGMDKNERQDLEEELHDIGRHYYDLIRRRKLTPPVAKRMIKARYEAPKGLEDAGIR